MNDNFWILNKISLKYVPNSPINNITALVQIIVGPDQRQVMIWTNDG